MTDAQFCPRSRSFLFTFAACQRGAVLLINFRSQHGKGQRSCQLQRRCAICLTLCTDSQSAFYCIEAEARHNVIRDNSYTTSVRCTQITHVMPYVAIVGRPTCAQTTSSRGPDRGSLYCRNFWAKLSYCFKDLRRKLSCSYCSIHTLSIANNSSQSAFHRLGPVGCADPAEVVTRVKRLNVAQDIQNCKFLRRQHI